MMCHLYLSRYKLFNYKYVHVVQRNVLYLNKDFFYRHFLAVELLNTVEPLCPSPAVPLWNDLGDSEFDGVGLAGFKSRAMLSC